MALANQFMRVIREAGGLGDSVRVLSVCRALKQKYPSAHIHYYSVNYLKHLIASRTKSYVDLFVGFECGIRPRDTNIKDYNHLNNKNIKYDITIDCWDPAYLHEPATRGIVALDRTQLWDDLGNLPFTRPKLDILDEDYDNMIKAIKSHGKKCTIGIQLGATCVSREIPYKKANELIQRLVKMGYHVILFDVCYRWKNDINIDNIELSINESWPITIGRLLSTSLLITPDSGFYHLSGALYHRTLGLFGCTSGQIISRPYQLEIPTHHYLEVRHSNIDYTKLPTNCIPKCYMRWERGWDFVRYRTNIKYCELMNQISVDSIVEKIQEITNNEPFYEHKELSYANLKI